MAFFSSSRSSFWSPWWTMTLSGASCERIIQSSENSADSVMMILGLSGSSCLSVVAASAGLAGAFDPAGFATLPAAL